MNSATGITLSLSEIVGILVACGTLIVTVVTLSLRIYSKFTTERTLTETAVEKLELKLRSEMEKKEAALWSVHKENAVAIQKNDEALGTLREFFRTELDKKVDGVTTALKSIETSLAQLGNTIAAKFVERPELDARFSKQEDRIAITEQGMMKMVNNSDQMLSILAQLRLDMKGKTNEPR